MHSGVPPLLAGKLKDLATEESEHLSYLFKDSIKFISKIISTYLDERTTRESIIAFLKILNIVCPVLLMNDFRIAKATNSLQRVEVLQNIISKI